MSALPLVIVGLLAFIAGLLLGFFGWTIYIRVERAYRLIKDRMEAPPGVVKVQKTRYTRNQPIDLGTETGGVMRPTPQQIALQNMKEREERIKNM